MPYGRKSGLRRHKAGGGFGKSLVSKKAGMIDGGAPAYQKPDISRLEVQGDETEGGVRLTQFLRRDPRVTALETDDFEDFLQVSLFKKTAPAELVICNRDGRAFSTKTAGEVKLHRRAELSDAKTASLQLLKLPVRPFAFRDQASRVLRFAKAIGSSGETLLSATADYFTERAELAPLLTKEQIAFEEARVFSEWREYLAEASSGVNGQPLVLTPYEKNLEYWRQLWRTLERSDLVLEIVDARNPLLFRSQALEELVQQHLGKQLKVCLNKTDHLSATQCAVWVDYFKNDLHLGEPILYSSMRELKKIDASYHTDQFLSIDAAEAWEHVLDVDGLTALIENARKAVEAERAKQLSEAQDAYDGLVARFDAIDMSELGGFYRQLQISATELLESPPLPRMGRAKPLTGEELVRLLLGPRPTPLPFVVGTVGFPNVGKSSLINSLMRGVAKVGVSRTPGKTRHLQTLMVPHTGGIMLCDCPGLVLPTASSSKEDLVINGVMSADSYRGTMVRTVRNLLLRVSHQVADLYNVVDEFARIGDALPEQAREVLEILAHQRGFYTGGKGGLPDVEKTARLLVKQYLEGRSLSFCEIPPSLSSADDATWLSEEHRKWLVRRELLTRK